MLIMFGGANRQQQHFSDLWILKMLTPIELGSSPTEPKVAWECIEATGDIPPPRSGHAMCIFEYSGFLFMFGGINYPEEVAFNDLYSLNLGMY